MSKSGKMLRTIAALMIAFVFVQCSTEKKQLPNVVFIIADDLGYGDLSCYGQKKFETPNIDALGKGGIIFTQHYSGSPVCAPSRSALMTGLHTGHTFIRGNREVQPEGQYPIPDSAQTLAEIFKSKGYVTGIFGKWGLGNMESEGNPLKQGFDQFYGFNCQRLAHNYYPPHLWKNSERITLNDNEGANNGSYAPEIIQRSALNFIEENKDKPFFLYLPVITPHAELVAPEKYMENQRGKYGTETPYKGTEPGSEHYKTGGYASQFEPKAAFAGIINLLDDQVGEIIAKLKESGLYENTVIVFTSDNGPHQEGGADPEYFDSNGVLRGFKRDVYEGGIRVPMIIHWYGKITPRTTDHISAFWDFVPTFAELIKTSTPHQLDGISMIPTLFNIGEQQKHPYLYWEFHEQGGRQAIRKENWKFVKLQVNDSIHVQTELYDLKNDEGETMNLIDKHPEQVAEFESLLKTVRTTNPVFKFARE